MFETHTHGKNILMHPSLKSPFTSLAELGGSIDAAMAPNCKLVSVFDEADPLRTGHLRWRLSIWALVFVCTDKLEVNCFGLSEYISTFVNGLVAA